jgi:DNA-binding CsgD family transcriptional regulator
MGGRRIHKCPLSEMEKEIIGLLCMEFSNKEISEKLFRSIHAIERARERIMKKIGAKNLAGVVNYGNRNGLNPNLKTEKDIPRGEVVRLKKFLNDKIKEITEDRITTEVNLSNYSYKSLYLIRNR